MMMKFASLSAIVAAACVNVQAAPVERSNAFWARINIVDNVQQTDDDALHNVENIVVDISGESDDRNDASSGTNSRIAKRGSTVWARTNIVGDPETVHGVKAYIEHVLNEVEIIDGIPSLGDEQARNDAVDNIKTTLDFVLGLPDDRNDNLSADNANNAITTKRDDIFWARTDVFGDVPQTSNDAVSNIKDTLNDFIGDTNDNSDVSSGDNGNGGNMINRGIWARTNVLDDLHNNIAGEAEDTIEDALDDVLGGYELDENDNGSDGVNGGSNDM